MFEIGTLAGGQPATLNLERLIGTHLAVVANSGAGKSWLIRKLLEATSGHVQQIVIDPDEDFYTLRELEGSSYVLIGSDTGDIPLTVEGAGELAWTLLEHGLSAILQVGQFTDIEDQQDFVGAFLEALIAAPRRLWHPMLCVVDEAQRFAPLNEKPSSLAGMVALAGQGRKRGFTAVYATQRLAQISRSATGPMNNWLLGRVGQSVDQRSVADNLGFSPSSAEARGLKALDDGQFWAFGPALSRSPELIKVGSVSTTHVKAGQAKVPTPPAPEALREILAALAPKPPESTAEAGSGSTAPEGQVDPQALSAANEAGRKAGFAEGRAVGLIEGREQALERMQGIREATETIGRAVTSITTIATQIIEDQPLRVSDARPAADPPKVARAADVQSGKIPQTHLRMLSAIAWWEANGIGVPTRAQVAAICGWKVTSGHLKNLAGALRGQGLISYPEGKRLELTAAGRTAAPAPDLKTRVVDTLRTVLDGPQQQVLNVMLDWPVSQVPRDGIAEACGWSPTSGHLKNVLGSMRTLQVLDYPAPGFVQLETWVRA